MGFGPKLSSNLNLIGLDEKDWTKALDQNPLDEKWAHTDTYSLASAAQVFFGSFSVHFSATVVAVGRYGILKYNFLSWRFYAMIIYSSFDIFLE